MTLKSAAVGMVYLSAVLCILANSYELFLSLVALIMVSYNYYLFRKEKLLVS